MSKTINTLFVGKVLHQFDSLPSTNLYAQELLSKNKPSEGTVILAFDQPKGRGQIGNKWESKAGKNLTFSIILYPRFLPVRKQFLLNQAISLSVFDTLHKYIPEGLTIKWPNDLYVFDKKITGILIQNSIKGSTLQSAIIGIGLNVNQKDFRNAPNPTSLSLEIGKESKLKNILAELLFHLEVRYLQLKSGNIEQIQNDYLIHLFRFGKEYEFKRPDGIIFKGIIQGITAIGKLIVKTEGGKEEFGFKEIKYVVY